MHQKAKVAVLDVSLTARGVGVLDILLTNATQQPPVKAKAFATTRRTAITTMSLQQLHRRTGRKDRKRKTMSTTTRAMRTGTLANRGTTRATVGLDTSRTRS